MLFNSLERYGLISKTLHWLLAIMILSMIGLGVYMTDLAKTDPLRPQLFGLHKAIGVTILMLVFVRIGWLFVSAPPPPPKALQRFEIVLAKAVIGMLYLLMLCIPIVGYLMSNAFGKPISYFGLFELPALIGKNPELGEALETAHMVLGYIIVAMVALHAAGAIKHRLFNSNPQADVLRRML